MGRTLFKEQQLFNGHGKRDIDNVHLSRIILDGQRGCAGRHLTSFRVHYMEIQSNWRRGEKIK